MNLPAFMGRQKFVDFDLFSPRVQSFPASVAECAAAGFAGTVEAGWACQDTATGLLSYSGAAAQTLVASATAGIKMGQPAHGFFDGASFRAQKAAEIQPELGGANRYACAAGGTLDHDWTTPWSQLIVFRISAPSGTYRVLQWKGTGVGAGWGLYAAASGALTLQVRDGTTGIIIDSPSNHADGEWHWAYARWNPTTDTLQLDTDLTTGLSVSTAAITTTTTAATYGLGDWPGTTTAFQGQIRGCIVFSDVLTTVAQIQAWWVKGNAPDFLTAARGGSYTRASSFNSIVADDATVGDVLSTYGVGKIAYEYNPLISTNALKLGMASYPACTNLLPGSNMNVAADWVNTTAGTGATALYDHDSPRGFREAIKHTKAAAADKNLTAAAKGAAVTLNSVYTASIWCCWDGTNTAPELQVYRADGTTMIGSVSAMNGTSLWRRISYTFTAPATETVRVAVMGAAAATLVGSAWFACPQVNTEDWAKPWVMTTAATAATAAIVAYATVDAMTSDYGTLKVWCTFAMPTSAVLRTIAGIGPASSSAISTMNAIGIDNISGSNIAANAPFAWSEGPAAFCNIAAQADLASAEIVLSALFDAAKRNAGKSVRLARSATVATATASLAAVVASTILQIGCSAGINQARGVISKVRVWRGVELSA